MFFFRKKTPETDENVAKKSIKHMDAVVTGVILGSIVGSIYGVAKLRKKHDQTPGSSTPQIEGAHPVNEKKTLLQRIFGK